MAVDFATLSITVKRDDVPKATAELDRLTAAGDRAEKSTQKLASANNTAGVSSVAATRNMGAWAAMQAESAGHVGEHSLAIGRLERVLAGIVGHFAGANAAAELLASGLLKFSIGTLETVGILGGLALVIGLYEKMTEGAREAKKQMDDMTDSLLKQARAAEEATIAGRQNLLLIAQINDQTANKESGIGWRSILGSIVTGHPFISGTDADAQAGRRADTASGVTQAQKNLNDAIEEARKKELERLHKIDEERAREQANLIRYNEMMEKAYGGTFDISPAARGPRSTWSGLGQSMSDDERAAINKSLGLDARGNVIIPSVSMPNVGINDGLTKEQVRQMEAIRQLNERYDEAKAKFGSMGAALDDFKHGLKQAATGILEQFSPSSIAQNIAGGMVSKVESLITGVIGSAIGGVRHAVFGQNAEERTAARQAADSAHAMALQLDAVTKSLSGDGLGAAIDNLKIGLIASLLAINEALPGKKNEAQRNADRTLAAQQEAEQEAKTRKQFAEQQQYAQEDLQVRLLRATGQGSAADLQGFKNQQAREMQAALDANKDATYLNTLKLVQNNELLAFLNGTLSDAVRNSPNGFFASAYYSQYATPRDYPSDSGVIGSDKTGWTGGGGRTKGNSPGNFTLTFQPGALVVDKNGMMNVVLEKIDIAASGIGGAGSSRSAALDTMTRK